MQVFMCGVIHASSSEMCPIMRAPVKREGKGRDKETDTGETKRNISEICLAEEKKKNVCSVTSFQLKMLQIFHFPLLCLTSAAQWQLCR